MYIGKEKEKLIFSDRLLSYFKNKNRESYKKYVDSAVNIEISASGSNHGPTKGSDSWGKM